MELSQTIKAGDWIKREPIGTANPRVTRVLELVDGGVMTPEGFVSNRALADHYSKTKAPARKAERRRR